MLEIQIICIIFANELENNTKYKCMLRPVIKWDGSKRSQAENDITYFPKDIDTYYEPLCGGASVFNVLLLVASKSIIIFVLMRIQI